MVRFASRRRPALLALGIAVTAALTATVVTAAWGSSSRSAAASRNNGLTTIRVVFDWPGIGTYAVQSILQSDHKAIIGFTIWIGALIVIVNLLVDITHSFIDPRGTR